MAHTGRLKRLFAIVPTSPEAPAIRDDVAFFDAVRESIAKIEAIDRGSTRTGARHGDPADRQRAHDRLGVIDIFAEAGLEKPDISVIDDEFRKKFEPPTKEPPARSSAPPDLQRGQAHRQGNVVAGRKFSEMLSDALNRYQNRTIDAAQVIAEIVEIAKAIHEQRQRGEDTGLTDNELAFYDALVTNESARLAMEDETLRKIAHELTEIVRNDAKTDWQVKETVRAKLRTRDQAPPAQARLPARPRADRDRPDHPAGRGHGGGRRVKKIRKQPNRARGRTKPTTREAARPLRVSIITSPTSQSGGPVLHRDVETVKAALLYADEVELVSPGAAMLGSVASWQRVEPRRSSKLSHQSTTRRWAT